MDINLTISNTSSFTGDSSSVTYALIFVLNFLSKSLSIAEHNSSKYSNVLSTRDTNSDANLRNLSFDYTLFFIGFVSVNSLHKLGTKA